MARVVKCPFVVASEPLVTIAQAVAQQLHLLMILSGHFFCFVLTSSLVLCCKHVCKKQRNFTCREQRVEEKRRGTSDIRTEEE